MDLNALLMLVVQLIILGVVVWVAHYLTTALPVPDPLGRIIRVVVMVICVVAALVLLLNFIGMGAAITG